MNTNKSRETLLKIKSTATVSMAGKHAISVLNISIAIRLAIKMRNKYRCRCLYALALLLTPQSEWTMQTFKIKDYYFHSSTMDSLLEPPICAAGIMTLN